MPSLFKSLSSKGGKAVHFPLTEYWVDIGRVSDYEKANADYFKYFYF